MSRTKTNYGVIGSVITVNKSSTGGIFSLQDQFVSTSSGNFPYGPMDGVPVSYLVQGGGGGGNIGVSSDHFGSGGAAGIQRNGNTAIVPGTSFTVTVGAGGAQASNGSSSVFSFSTITATGGEGPLATNKDGGRNADFAGGIWVSGTPAGGGAGSGAAGGLAGGGANLSVGGNGYTWWADGVTRGGGGSSSSAAAGSGGGGVGSTVGVGGNGTANTGSGGGGSITSGGAGGSGGNGVIILRYPNTYANITTIGAGLTYAWSSNNGFKYYTFTAGTGTVTW